MDSRLAIAALEYARRGWFVFPCQGKRPLTRLVRRGYLDASDDPAQIRSWWSQEPKANIGLALDRSGLVCIDVDRYKPDCGFEGFMATHDLPETLEQRSCRSGSHFLFRSPEHAKFNGKLCVGVDIKHKGYILLEPSVAEGGQYLWQNDNDIAIAPAWLLSSKSGVLSTEAVTQPEASSTTERFQFDTGDVAELRRLLETAVNDLDRNDWVKLAASIRCAYGDTLREPFLAYSQRYEKGDCTRVEAERVWNSVASPKEVSSAAPAFALLRGRSRSQLSFDDGVQFSDDLLIKSSKGILEKTNANLLAILRGHPEWRGVLGLNEMTGRIVVIMAPPYEPSAKMPWVVRDLDDTDYTRTTEWMERNYTGFAKQFVVDCINVVGHESPFNPAYDYLEQCKKPLEAGSLLNCWMQKFLGVHCESEQDLQYVQAVSRLALIQAVARIYQPGCKADAVVILEGAQGTGKSTAIRTLFGPDYFGDNIPPMGQKDASDYVRGKWCIELAELDYKGKSETEAIKAFISRQEEQFRPAYGRQEVTYPRRCVFWGTTNRDDYLKDTSGNRRFLPIRSGHIDIPGLAAARDQLFAEAVAAYKHGEQWWLSGHNAEYAATVTEQRMESDPWVQVMRERLQNYSEITIKKAIEISLNRDGNGIGETQITPQISRRVADCLVAAGWKRNGKYHTGSQRNQVRFTRAQSEIGLNDGLDDEF